MLPDSVLSTETLEALFCFPRNVPRAPLIDYEYGGAAIQDASQGLRYQVWKGEYLENAIVLSAPVVPAFNALAIANVDTFGFTFDQNMQPFFCYELVNGNAFFRWFDGTVPGFVTTQLPPGTRTPRCCLDDNRRQQIGVSDIILAYCRDEALYFRAQRERFEDEHLLHESIGAARLIQIGMNKVLRFQFQLSSLPTTLGDSPADSP
jgi:hypothetical protein